VWFRYGSRVSKCSVDLDQDLDDLLLEVTRVVQSGCASDLKCCSPNSSVQLPRSTTIGAIVAMGIGQDEDSALIIESSLALTTPARAQATAGNSMLLDLVVPESDEDDVPAMARVESSPETRFEPTPAAAMPIKPDAEKHATSQPQVDNQAKRRKALTKWEIIVSKLPGSALPFWTKGTSEYSMMQRALKTQCTRKLSPTQPVEEQEHALKQVVDFLCKFLPSAHYDRGFLRGKILRHLQYLRQKTVPSKATVDPDMLDDDFNDVSDIDVRYASLRKKPQSSQDVSVSPNNSAPAPLPEEDDTDTDAQAEEVRAVKKLKSSASKASSKGKKAGPPAKKPKLDDADIAAIADVDSEESVPTKAQKTSKGRAVNKPLKLRTALEQALAKSQQQQ